MQAKGTGERVHEGDVFGVGGDDVGEVQTVEVGGADDWLVVDVADYGLC